MDQVTVRKWQLCWRWPLFSLVTISAFWMIWHLIAGSIPSQGWQFYSWTFQPVSRLWDLVYVPLVALTMTASFLNIKFDPEIKNHRSEFVMGSTMVPVACFMIGAFMAFILYLFNYRDAVTTCMLICFAYYGFATIIVSGPNGLLFRGAIISLYIWLGAGPTAGLLVCLGSWAVWILLQALVHNLRWSFWPHFGRFITGKRWQQAT
ncbi:MAG: hypothetical protein ABIB97_02880 [Patescibacteria group bacterium]